MISHVHLKIIPFICSTRGLLCFNGNYSKYNLNVFTMIFVSLSNFGQSSIVITSNIHLCTCENLAPASIQKLYMTTVSCVQGRSIFHGTCALSSYFNCLTISIANMTFTLKVLSGPLLENYKWQLVITLFI